MSAELINAINALREAIFILVKKLPAIEVQNSPQNWIISYKNPLETILEPSNRGGSRGGRKELCQVKNDRTNKTAPSEIFQKFYVEYPKHVGRGAAAKAFVRAMKKATPEQVTEGARKYASWCKKTGRESRFIPNPATWLNQERWDDDLPALDTSAMLRRVNDLEKERKRHVAEFDGARVREIDAELHGLRAIIKV